MQIQYIEYKYLYYVTWNILFNTVENDNFVWVILSTKR